MRPKRLPFLSITLSVLVVLSVQPSTRVLGSSQYGSPLTIATGQCLPIDIAVGGTGIVYWANQCNGLLQSLPPGATSPTTLVSGLQNVQGVGVDAAGNVYYDEYFQGILYKLPAGSSTPQVLATGLDYPNFMSAAANGTVFFVTGQTAGDKIVRFNPSTSTLTTILTAPTPYDTNHGFGGLYITPSGDLYYTITIQPGSAYGTINRLPAGASTPQTILTVPVTQEFQWPSGVAADGSRNVFFTIYGESVDVLPAGSSMPVALMSEPAFTDGFAHEMALDSYDNVYFTDSYAGNIWEIPRQFGMTVSYQVNGGGSGYSAPVFNYVWGHIGKKLILTTTPTPVNVDAGSSWYVSNPLPGSTGSERWQTFQPTGGTASTGTINFVYQNQYKLAILLNPSTGGTLTQSSSTWRNPAASVTVQATPASNYVFLSWTGVGSGSYSGASDPATVTMNGPIVETANFQQLGGQLTVSLVKPNNGATIYSSPVTLNVTVNGFVQGASVTIYLDGNQACSGSSNATGSYSCKVTVTKTGGTHSWYATASKTGFTSGTSPTWTFTY